jgi:hypothetical protein
LFALPQRLCRSIQAPGDGHYDVMVAPDILRALRGDWATVCFCIDFPSLGFAFVWIDSLTQHLRPAIGLLGMVFFVDRQGDDR